LIPLEVAWYIGWRDRGELPRPLYEMPSDEAMMILAIDAEVRSHGL
jgi:hypothetical protein